MITVGIPVLRRYDLLRELLTSLAQSECRPGSVCIIDNGRDARSLAEATRIAMPCPIVVHTPETPMGVAESWNWLIQHTEGERVISNDDIRFYPESLGMMLATPGDLVFGYGYSCFLIRDSCVAKVGLFDETISPGYAYWEDIDYDTRIDQVTPTPVKVNAGCRMDHGGSRTNAVATPEQIRDHHERFTLAHYNYCMKWRELPRHMISEAALR